MLSTTTTLLPSLEGLLSAPPIRNVLLLNLSLQDLAQLSLTSRNCHRYCQDYWQALPRPQPDPAHPDAVIFQSFLHFLLTSERIEAREQGMGLVMQWIKAQLRSEWRDLEQHFASVNRNLTHTFLGEMQALQTTVEQNWTFVFLEEELSQKFSRDRPTDDPIWDKHVFQRWYEYILQQYSNLAAGFSINSYLCEAMLKYLAQQSNDRAIAKQEPVQLPPYSERSITGSAIRRLGTKARLLAISFALKQCDAQADQIISVNDAQKAQGICSIKTELKNIADAFEKIQGGIERFIHFAGIFEKQLIQIWQLSVDRKIDVEALSDSIGFSAREIDQFNLFNAAHKDQLEEQLKTMASETVALKHEIHQSLTAAPKENANVSSAGDILAGIGNYG